MKSVQKIDLGLTGYDELFMNDAERKENKLPRIYDIPLSEIDDFPDHPFKVKLDEDMDQLVVADLGLWNGRRTGYKEIPSGNIRDCLYSDYDYTTWYVDRNGDFRCDDTHHDGTNHYLYRVYKDNVSQAQKDRLKEKIYNGTATRADIVRVTRRLGDEIGKVYGWSFPTRQRERGEAR